MRTIKFRGKSKKTGEWIIGYYLKNRGVDFVCPDEFANGKTWEDYEVIPETVGQFTGLLDKNDSEICEGDVLAYTKYERTTILLVEYKFGAFGYTYIDEFHALSGNPNFSFGTFGADADFEIVGNIHDNPELLKGGVE